MVATLNTQPDGDDRGERIQCDHAPQLVAPPLLAVTGMADEGTDLE